MSQIFWGQNVTVTVQVLPPYSTYLPDYLNNPSRIYFTLLSNEDVMVKLKATITGDNGITLTTATTATANSIQLLANQTKMMNGTDLKKVLDINNVTVSGINKNELYKGSGIPEGIYTLCIQAIDSDTEVPLSEAEPLGCSFPFNIQQVNPPQLLSPTCDAFIESTVPQNMVFTWLPPQGAPVTTVYRLKIVEIIPKTKNPNDAMNSATTPTFFETTTNTFSFFYGPAQPPLKVGSKYAWRVTAMSNIAGGVPSATVTQSNFQNNGNSEVCSFEYTNAKPAVESATLPSSIQLIYPINKQKVASGYGFDFSWTASTNPNVKAYQVQTTNSINDKKNIKEWNEISSTLFKYEYNYAVLKAGANLKINMPANYAYQLGKNAWRVVGLDANKNVIETTQVESFEIGDAPSSDKIKLISPIQGKKITSGYGLKFQWESSKKQIVSSYELQFTDHISQDVKISDWNNLSENLFTPNVGFYAIKETQDLFVNLPNSFTDGLGKIAWRVIARDASNTIVDKSDIETYEIVEDKSDIASLKGFFINGYYVQITNFFDKNPDKFSGSGTMMLWENGPEINFNFKDLKIKPIVYLAKLQQYHWAAVSGIIDINTKGMLPNNRIDLETQNDCDGAFQAILNSMKIIANAEGTMDANNKIFKISKDLGTTTGKVIGKWFTNWFIPVNGKQSENLYELESEESAIKMSFANKFDGEITLKSDKIIETIANGNVSCDFANNFGSQTGSVKLKIKALTAESSLTGEILVYSANPTDPNSFYHEGLVIPFVNEKNLNFYYTFQKPLLWKLNDDASVKANLKETYVHLSDNGKIEPKFENYPNGLNFDKFDVSVNLPTQPNQTKSSTINLSFDKVFNKGKGYSTTGKAEDDTNSTIDVAGFTTKINQSKFMLINNKLVYMYLKGALYVPFINDWSAIFIEIDAKKLQSFNLDFDFNKKYYLNKSKGEAYIKLYSGRFENNLIAVAPTLFMNNDGNKGIETNGLSMCEFYIENSGAVSFDTNFAANAESVCEGSKKWATFYQFDFGIDKIKIKQKTNKNDTEFLFSGDIILAPNIAVSSKKETGFVYHGKAPSPGNSINTVQELGLPGNGGLPKQNIPKGPALSEVTYDSTFENTIEFTDDNKAVAGTYEDGAQKFGGGFFLKQNDPVWGDYFELGGSYEMKEPKCINLTAKLIVGKKKKLGSKYSYWFSEFYQKNLIIVPIIPKILDANGFGGKAYYHMQVEYNNEGLISKMFPNTNYSLGIVAEANVRTSEDEGILLHGHTTIVTQFKGWSIDGINYYIKGDAIAPDDSSPGLLQARMNGQLNWVDKYIDGKGQIWGNVHDLVCINEGTANEDAVFFHFGADDFYIKIGTKESPITTGVFCGSKLSMQVGTWLIFSKSNFQYGVNQSYDSGWVGVNLKIAEAAVALAASLSANVNVNYSPFQATGTASFAGTASAKGCLKWIGCKSGSVDKSANLSVSLPNPVVFEGSINCKVSRWIPGFTLHAKWSSTGGFNISI